MRTSHFFRTDVSTVSGSQTGVIRMSKEVVLKRDVILAVAEVLLRLGKGDYEGTRKYMIRARELFETWVETRPELHERSKKFNEDQG